MSQQNVDLVKAGYAAFTAGDVEKMMSLVDDGIEWIQPGEATISGTFRGKGELGEFLARLAEKSPTVRPQRFVADEDTVIVFSELAVGGETSDVVQVHTVRDGKSTRVKVYGDTAMSERIFGRKHVTAN